MKNKFTQSILERLSEESEKQKDTLKSAAIEQKIKSPEKQERKVKTKIVSTEKLPDISAFIDKKEDRIAKNKTFYLDTDVIEQIKAVAKQQNITDSKLVNDILKKVLRLD